VMSVSATTAMSALLPKNALITESMRQRRRAGARMTGGIVATSAMLNHAVPGAPRANGEVLQLRDSGQEMKVAMKAGAGSWGKAPSVRRRRRAPPSSCMMQPTCRDYAQRQMRAHDCKGRSCYRIMAAQFASEGIAVTC
jgi:hypothetical protein